LKLLIKTQNYPVFGGVEESNVKERKGKKYYGYGNGREV